MKLTTQTPKIALNKAYLKERINRPDIEKFKDNFKQVFGRLKASDKESEEFYKNIVSDFLKNTFYTPQYEINTKGREDLVIHTGKTTKDSVGVIFETKKPNSSEMLTDAKPNVKALHQLIFYYLQERIDHKNIHVKHLIITDIYNWYIFDENLFDKHFYHNTALVKGYETFKQSGKNTEFFYKDVAKPILDGLDIDLECTHFDLKDYEKTVTNTDLDDDKKLIALYKILSPVHLLKLPFANDSNQLDKNFYAELLHIIGLEEIKEGSKKLINRKAKPDEFSLLENAITKVENRGFSDVPDLSKLGSNRTEQAYNIALELSITWVNRILFLKLLEAQLITYHKGNKDFRFLNPSVIYDYDRLNKLFFEVLAEKTDKRKGKTKIEFERIPYLNSSLFERTELERKTIEISSLDDSETIPILSNTVLKDDKGKKRTGNLPTLEYLFAFLDAYDFASEGTEDIQDDKRTLINASVLGLIFEKINGYKDGSFFTPGFITMYMCRETIRRAVLQKFKETNLPNFQNLVNFDDLKDAITDRKQANDIINSLKICDPAVGSGHFLVSALNEIISIKSDLDVLIHRDGKRVRNYKIEIQNDELIVTDENEGDIFQYFVNDKGIPPKEVQQLQETLFHEKQTIIENCLFGVDINPNSVKICRLRLWIELLKNAFYTEGSNFKELETLPNIDINIKQGNSLISRFKLNDDLSEVFKKHKFSYKAYRKAVEDYKNTNTKEAKRELTHYIHEIKEQFQTSFHSRIKENKELAKFRGQLYNTQNQGDLFGGKVDKIEVDRLEKLVAQFEQKVKDIKDNAIFSDAFEWRFEFPEVLNNEGNYVGFDSIIGNPPYGVNMSRESGEFFKRDFDTFNWRGESYTLFAERGLQILRTKGNLSFIIPDTLLNLGFTQSTRSHLLSRSKLYEIDLLPSNVFNDATVDTILFFTEKQEETKDFIENDVIVRLFNKKSTIQSLEEPEKSFFIPTEKWFKQESFNLQSDNIESTIIDKIESQFEKLDSFVEMFYGIKAYQVGKGKPNQTREIVDTKPFTSENQVNQNWLPFFDGKHIGHYDLLWKNNNWINYGSWLAEPRSPIKFEGEKILIRKIVGKTLIANYIPYTSYCNTLLFVLKLKVHAQISYKALTGIINSNFIGWYFRKKFQISNEDTFPQIMIRDILQFAVPNVQNETTKQIEKLVETIIEMKQSTPSVSTGDLEKDIDNLVYGLYGLTDEEIEIIENTIK